ncbi:adenine phosphoribosyltransferase [Cellulomonas sp. zg-ZUI222]|uniref:Adenine phosphoribosyltransferase n=1 Tax=Cellulomonas wangleii TaxID=2816956 RepID=A0ABX8D935_9CELL|nr:MULTISPECIES: adenine phosphoribosyltransferase [Cellulomonas]MBO0900398.1 adenine phosphoribosyltransferase [Cellulomonas sp. zg-ZUI22]MBO0922772.1 adenine phosphoribosyltransferase [Cellulomonas wangleii]MBO0926363.1 adenine phosphoribosyltransferase [Cellulomonas wangleii]QVI63954.1 adenine phosphoribosyltransferase [Cellulomonas wangleii]
MSPQPDGPVTVPGPSDQRAALAGRIDALMRTVPDYPEPGVLFRDIMPLLADAGAFAEVVGALAADAPGPIDLVAGMEARGFLLAAPVATALGAGVVPVRKAGKLPGPVASQTYALEYGTAAVEVQPFTIPDGARVLVVDDVLATGGTAAATVELLESCGATVVGLSFLVELEALGGRAQLPGRFVDALLTIA